MHDELREYYENVLGEEEIRLNANGVQYIEFLTTTAYLEKILPPKCNILDSCAGTGAYAFYLSQKGYDVTAGDIVPLNVSLMREKQKNTTNPLTKIYEGNALDLSRFPDESFDVVLCMGAMYHLHKEDERLKAIQESMRVLKKDGILALSYMNKYAVILNNFEGSLDNIDEIVDFIDNSSQDIFYTTSPKEILSMVEMFPLEKMYHIGTDGIGYLLYGIAGLIDEKGLERFRCYHLKSCEEESILGYSYHALYIGKKI